jgi:hypothetical protein
MAEDTILKGNFVTKKQVVIEKNPVENLTSSEKIARELKEAVLQELGGSMVYVERTNLAWDGSDN